MATKKAAGLGDIARSKIFSIDYETNAFQLYANGPYFADRNVGATSATETGSTMYFTEATAENFTWGPNWCTPSKVQMDELLKAATSEGSTKVDCNYIQENGVYGFKFTGKENGYTGNSVFYPAQNGSSSLGFARYWSGTANDSEAWRMRLYYVSGDWRSGWYSGNQDYDYLVRPVFVN